MSELTPEKLYDIYAFKLLKRGFKKEYPWITDVFVTQNELDKYGTVFLNFDFDPYEFAKTYDTEINDYIGEMIKNGDHINLIYPSIIGDMTHDEFTGIRDQIQRLIKTITNNPTLPDEFKIRRAIDLGSWNINRNGRGSYWSV
jgi:hypothetical protein